MSQNLTTSTYLPAVSPDLVLVLWGHGEWQVKSLSDRLALWSAIDTDQIRGRSPAALFPDAVPDIISLANEVLQQGQDLTAVKLQLLPERPEFFADVQFAGLTEDYLGQLVRISLRDGSVASQQEKGFRNMVGSSPAVFRKIRLYAASDASVIITGETGAGKELVAHALHEESPRHTKPFAALNCTAISEQLLESELFGHERGAFTGALREHHGYFERVDGGTLFLDEIGDMPMHTQAKLLRVLEDGQVQRVGSEKSRQVDVRFIGATNIFLEQAVAEKKFRADLYHRLAVLRIHVPPLRERPEDIPLLAEIFLQEFNSKYGKGIKRLTNEAVRLLQSYLWPGNIRELKNVIERVVVESETEAIGARSFSEWIHERQQFAGAVNSLSVETQRKNLPAVIPYSSIAQPPLSSAGSVQSPLGQRVELSEDLIRQAYRDEGGNLSAAARRLGVHRATLYRHLQRLNLTRKDIS